MLVHREGTQPDWARLKGADQRDFRPTEDQRFEVTVALPPATNEGTYGFQLVVANAADPQRDFTEGDPVTIKHQPAGPVTPPPAPPWWLWAAIAAVVLLVIGGVAFLLLPNGNDVPTDGTTQPSGVPMIHVVGRPVEQARQLLDEKGIKHKEAPVVRQGQKGHVVAQSVAENQTVDPATEVVLEVQGVAVPSVRTPADLGAAALALRNAGLKVGEIRGTLSEQFQRFEPASGTPVFDGSEVAIVVAGRPIIIRGEQMHERLRTIDPRLFEIQPKQ
jgi:hypothetical protein